MGILLMILAILAFLLTGGMGWPVSVLLLVVAAVASRNETVETAE